MASRLGLAGRPGAAVLFLPLLYPAGRLPSPRWRLVAWLGLFALLLTSVSYAVRPGPMLSSEVPVAANPLGIAGAGGFLEALELVGFWLFIPLAVAAQASLLLRLRRARGVERQQLKWFVSAAVALVAFFALFPLSLLLLGDPGELVIDLISGVVILGFPVALGIAVLRYRLYEIDRLVNRTLVYGLLTALLGLVYAGGVFVLGRLLDPAGGRSGLAVAASTLAVAALFQPARRRVQAAVDRRFNRRRYDATRTVEAFSARLRDQIDLDTLSAELLSVIDQTMQPTRASLWLRATQANRPQPGVPNRANVA
jgi:hypothetical protein